MAGGRDIHVTVAFNIDSLREMGIGVEIDDFGTGRASMLALSRLRPDKLKIDRHFVGPIVESAKHQQLVSGIIAIGRSMGVKVVAEDVEDLHQAEILFSLGCDELQGFVFGRPMTGDEMASVLLAGPSLRAVGAGQ